MFKNFLPSDELLVGNVSDVGSDSIFNSSSSSDIAGELD
jgi:hypothetical protein